MRKVLLAISLLVLVGCQEGSYSVSSDVYDQVCIDGVIYFENQSKYSNTYNLTAKFTVDGSVATCLDEESLIEYEEDLAFYE